MATTNVHDIDLIIDERDRFKAEAEEARERLWRSERQVKQLTATVSELQKELQVVRDALKTEREFLTNESTADSNRLITQLGDINQAIEDITYHLLHKSWIDDQLAQQLLNTTLTKDVINSFFGGLDQRLIGHLFPLALAALDRKVTIRTFLQPMIQYLFLDILQADVFEPFIPGLKTEQDEVTRKNYQILCTSEPQDRIAKWRSSNYERARSRRDDSALIHAGASRCASLLKKLLGTGKAYSLPEQTLNLVVQAMERVMLYSIKWQDQARTAFLLYEYSPSMHWDVPFDPLSMERVEMGSESLIGGHVLVCVAMGVTAVRSVVGQDGKIQKEGRIYSKARVICGDRP